MNLRQLIVDWKLKGAPQLPPRTRVWAWSSRCALPSLFLLVGSLAGVAIAQSYPPSPGKSGETFMVSGTVVNSVTGEAIGHALVRINSFPQRTSFSDGEGHFEIDGLAAGRANITAQKPGYVSDQDASGPSRTWVTIGSNSGVVLLKLTPLGAIYGRTTDSLGQPIEHVPVRLTDRILREGRKHWEQRGMTETDEDGRFRFPNLMPGPYYLAAGPSNVGAQLLAADEKPKTGFPLVYYPGVPDVSSASPIQLSAGQQGEADFSLSAVPVYQLSGSVTGYLAEQGVGVQVFNPSGEEAAFTARFNPDSGVIHVENVPAGNYIVRAFAQTGTQMLRAEVRVNVAANLDNLRLVLGPAVSIPVMVRMDSRNSGNLAVAGASLNQDRPPVSVRLISNETTAPEVDSTFTQQSSGHSGLVLQNVDSGTYAVEVTPQAPWYVQSATYGQTNILYDDLSVATGGPSYPMEIVLRNDSASLTGSIKNSDGGATPATVIVAPQPASKITPKLAQAGSGSFNVTGLAPGEYLVYAFDQTDGMEYGNPEVLQGYASQATHVTLSANQNAQVAVDLIKTGKGD
jgi:Carboxypeptidase regulatory-like domain